MVTPTKNSIREDFRKKRNSISERNRKLKSRDICQNFYSNISIKKNSKIAFYMATKVEPNLQILLELYQEDGHIICLPCVEETNAPMIFRKYMIGAPLQKNREFGFLEPPTHFETIIPDVIITPLVAFDAKCNRLGQGGGYYDRTFEYLSGFAEFITIGTAFKEQQSSFIPTNRNDFRLDAIVTDERVITI